jgi:hypothetical protein
VATSVRGSRATHLAASSSQEIHRTAQPLIVIDCPPCQPFFPQSPRKYPFFCSPLWCNVVNTESAVT